MSTALRVPIPLSQHDLAGYRPGTPPPSPLGFTADEFDRPIAEDATCPICDHRGLHYRPYVARQGRGYRAFAVCPRCQHADEF